MKVSEIINESPSSILYHYAPYDAAVKILRDDEFILSPSFRNDLETSTEYSRMFFLSTARSLNSYYIRKQYDGVVFVLDGHKFNQKTRPIHYYQNKDDRKLDELEDRVLSDSQTLDASPRIKYIMTFGKHHNRKLVNDLAEAIDIQVYNYEDKKGIFLPKRDNQYIIDVSKETSPEFEEQHIEDIESDVELVQAFVDLENGITDNIDILDSIYYFTSDSSYQYLRDAVQRLSFNVQKSSDQALRKLYQDLANILRRKNRMKLKDLYYANEDKYDKAIS